MRTKTFNVSGGMIAPFFGFIDGTMLQIELAEINDDQQIVVNVSYTDDDKESMMDLIDLYDELSEEELRAEEESENEEEESEE